MPAPEQRETYCHECLTENPRTRTVCVNCGARLRHPRDFAQDLKDVTPKVNAGTFGVVGAAVAATLYFLAIAVLLPSWWSERLATVIAGGVVVAVLGRWFGRFLARHANDSSVSGIR